MGYFYTTDEGFKVLDLIDENFSKYPRDRIVKEIMNILYFQNIHYKVDFISDMIDIYGYLKDKKMDRMNNKEKAKMLFKGKGK